MTSDRRYANTPEIHIESYVFEKVESFTYLESIVHMNNDITQEIKHCITVVNKCYFGLLQHMKSHVLLRSIKVLICKTLIRPILTYASETWTISKTNEYDLFCFERKILNRIYGPVFENGIWRKRYNQELYTLFKNPDISKYIKISRLRWAGHLMRMKDEEIPRKIITLQMGGQRGRVRLRMRWIDGVNGDAVSLRMRNWRMIVLDWDRWRRVLEEAQIQR
ncbi:hypothetical protein ANN_26915 [Periplaneta americana]|uniref:Endonuclease-reverse transcriptase n=1 Tax=Periplaneta americana TaxID=6978 RepID=A0ABQ8RWP1_PERAM|nr:hypothetical protein ANN_26915 [Periplaneta americana]